MLILALVSGVRAVDDGAAPDVPPTADARDLRDRERTRTGGQTTFSLTGNR
jgi:hypothetical protein